MKVLQHLPMRGLILLVACLRSASYGWKVCSIDDAAYSSRCDKNDCTDGVRGALKDCVGGGTIRVKAGEYTTAPFNLTSNQVLLVEEGATLYGTLNTSQIPVMAPFPSYGTCGV